MVICFSAGRSRTIQQTTLPQKSSSDYVTPCYVPLVMKLRPGSFLCSYLIFSLLLPRENVLGEAAHLLTVVKGQVLMISLLFSSRRRTLSLVTPSSRGTNLFLPEIFFRVIILIFYEILICSLTSF